MFLPNYIVSIKGFILYTISTFRRKSRGVLQLLCDMFWKWGLSERKCRDQRLSLSLRQFMVVQDAANTFLPDAVWV